MPGDAWLGLVTVMAGGVRSMPATGADALASMCGFGVLSSATSSSATTKQTNLPLLASVSRVMFSPSV